MAKFVPVAKASQLQEGEVRAIELEGGARIAICRAEGQLYAFEDVCTHDDGPLAEGELIGCAIECPRHGARFDVRTGAVLAMPAVFPIKTFALKVEDDAVLVDLEAL
jgi:3-phenylpropionate/trans-cinnamate dioxygenase ferredoxin subunit